MKVIGGDECIFTGLALRLSKCGAWQLEGGCHSIEVVKAISCGHAVQVPVSEASLIEDERRYAHSRMPVSAVVVVAKISRNLKVVCAKTSLASVCCISGFWH